MKTIVLFFVMFVTLTAVTASHNKHKTKESNSDGPEENDWPKPESVGEFGVPPEYGGPPPSDGGDSSAGFPAGKPAGGDPSGKSHTRSGRHH